MISGHDARASGTPWHPSGRAIDIQIYDDKGKALSNLGAKNDGSFGVYEKYYQSANERMQEKYGTSMAWGGGFQSGVANDKMHMQTQGAMAAYDPKTGLKSGFQSYAPDKSNMTPQQLKEYQSGVQQRIAAAKTGSGVFAGPGVPTNLPGTILSPSLPGFKMQEAQQFQQPYDGMNSSTMEETKPSVDPASLEPAKDDTAPSVNQVEAEGYKAGDSGPSAQSKSDANDVLNPPSHNPEAEKAGPGRDENLDGFAWQVE